MKSKTRIDYVMSSAGQSVGSRATEPIKMHMNPNKTERKTEAGRRRWRDEAFGDPQKTPEDQVMHSWVSGAD